MLTDSNLHSQCLVKLQLNLIRIKMEPFWGSFRASKLVCFLLVCLTAESLVSGQTGAGTLYRGKYIGKIQARQHKVSGDVYAVDARTLHIRAFTYDGTGPDAFFWTGFTENPSPEGIIIPDENGSKAVLGAYNARDITLTLPDGLTLREVKWLSIWCRAYEVNFGDMYIPADLDYPQPHVIGSLSGQHGVSSGPIVVVDAQTILVPDFTYDGQAPDVHFWVGRGKPGPEGIRVPDETGGDTPLTKSDKKTMVLTLPGDLTIFDIDFFGVWCRLYYVDFGHVKILPGLNVPPSLRMLGVTPQTKLNCEVLWDDLALEIRWAVAGESIVMQMVGKIEDGQYMSFGLSGDDSRSVMIGGDVVVGWFDKVAGRGHVVDYYLDGKSQCSGRRGTCPDSRLQAESNNVRLLSATVVNGFTMLTFQRPLLAHDELDRSILTNRSQPVIWAVGPINQREEASYHTLKNRDSIYIEFGRVPKWNCPAPDAEPPSSKLQAVDASGSSKSGVVVQLTDQPRPVELGIPIHATTTTTAATTTTTTTLTSRPIPQIPFKPSTSPAWNVPPILCHEPEDRVFYAQMGPTGGKRGYSAITGHVGWGIAWYINGLLVPEVHLVRGRTYTFVVEGGDNPEVAARYHPFYITDDPEGGYQYKTQAEKNAVKVFAGVGQDSTGKSLPTATGRLCQWTENNDQPADGFSSYGAYQRSLSLHCDEGHPGILHWTPDEHTPDTVYYQCYTHRYLGWKIRVVDSCDGDQSSQPLAGARDQELGESISHGTKTGAPLQKLLNDAKADADGTGTTTTSTGSEGRILPQQPSPPAAAANPQHQHQQHPPPSTFSDKSLVLNEKQEPLILQPGGPLGPQQLEFRGPDGVPYTGNVFIRNPEEGHSPQQHVIISHGHAHGHTHAQAHPPYASYTPDVRNPQPSRNSHPIRFVDAYGQRVRVGDGSRIYVESGPASDYVLGPTRVPLASHSGRYEGLPSMILASTVPPQILAAAPAYNKAEFATIQNVGNRGPEGSSLLQGSLVRVKDVRLRPDQLPLSSENVKYIEYPPAHLRVGANEGPVSVSGVRNRPNWPHSRNLPKRDELRAAGTDPELPSMEQLRRSLQSLDERGDFEIIKVNDTSLLPFDLNPTTPTSPSAVHLFSGKQSGGSLSPRIKSTPENSSAGTPKFYLVEDSGHGRKDEEVGGFLRSYSFVQRLGDARQGAELMSSSPQLMLALEGQGLTTSQGQGQVEQPRIPVLHMNTAANDTDWPGVQKSLEIRLRGHIMSETGRDPGVVSVDFQPLSSDSNLHRFSFQGGSFPAGGEGFKAPSSSSPTTSNPPSATTYPAWEPNPENQPTPGFPDTTFEPSSSSLDPDLGSDLSKYQALDSLPIFIVPRKVYSQLSTKSAAARNTVILQRFPPNNSHFNKQEYLPVSTAQHGSRQVPYPPLVKRGPISNLNVHDMERVSESKDLQSEANQHGAPSILKAPTHAHARGPIPRLPPAQPGTILAFDGRHVGLNNGEFNFRPPSNPPTPSIQNKPQFVPYRGELPSPVLELAENYPHLSGRHPPGLRQMQREPLQGSSGPPSQIGNHNLIPRPRPSKLEYGDDITMVYIKGTDERELQRELPKIISQVQKQAYEQEGGKVPTEPQFSPTSESQESRGTGESEENIQILHGHGQGYNKPSQTQQRFSSAPRQDVVPANNTDLHILTDIWSIINNQDEQSSSKPRPMSTSSYRPGSPQRSGLPIPGQSRPSPVLVPQRRM